MLLLPPTTGITTLPTLVRHRFQPTTADVASLLEAVSEAEPVSEEALPAASLAAHALSALAHAAPWLRPTRVSVSVRGIAHAGGVARVAGLAIPSGPDRGRASLRVSQAVGPVLEISVRGARERLHASAPEDSIPADLVDFGQALGRGPEAYLGATCWPAEFVVALAAAGVEAENDAPLSRLLELHLDLLQPGSLARHLSFALDGVKSISGDLARVVFHVTSGRARVVARGEAIIVGALARSAAMSLRLVA